MLTDVATSIGVLADVAVVVVTGVEILDPAIAVVVALYILWSGWGVLARSMSSLLDEAAPVAELRRIRDVIAANTGYAIETHDLRTRRSGRTTYIELHLVVPGRMTVARSHEICDRLEAALGDTLQGAVVTIHVEPDHDA